MRKLTQKVANWQLGCKEVDARFHPGFYQHYRVFCNDQAENIKNLLPRSLLDMLSQHPGWNIEAMDRWLLIYRQGKTVEANAFDPFFNAVMDIYKHFNK